MKSNDVITQNAYYIHFQIGALNHTSAKIEAMMRGADVTGRPEVQYMIYIFLSLISTVLVRYMIKESKWSELDVPNANVNQLSRNLGPGGCTFINNKLNMHL